MPRTKMIARPTAEDAELAKRIGSRIREARLRAGLTQQQLAGERYTKAYVSALETGIARPSMVALSYLSRRLNLPASHFIDEAHPAWTRLEVDMRLAAGEWTEAVDGYRALLDDATDETVRADLLRGLAEALARLDRGRETITAASESARLYGEAGREGDAALARYWLAVEPDFEMRLLTALAAVESRSGQPARSLTYLEEARGLASDLDDRRRAAFLFNLAISYREVGDFEAAIRAGTQGMALYRAAGAEFESARIENDLALAYLATGQVGRARELAADARRQIEETGDDRWLAAVIDTEAQVALADGDADAALRLSALASEHATRSGNELARLAAVITEARALRRSGRGPEAEERFGTAAEIARTSRVPSRLKDVLREWADLRAEAGDHRGAYQLTSEALAVN